MTPEIFIKRQCQVSFVEHKEVIQSLWSGYGEIARYTIGDQGFQSSSYIIAKHCTFPVSINHPRGWQSDYAHNRKIRSYEVEQCWYQDWAFRCLESAQVAHCHGVYFDKQSGQRLTLLEDLGASGYAARYDTDNDQHLLSCINWLAAFHAGFIHQTPASDWPKGLWRKGTYWHLDTRQEEWMAMEEGELKSSAAALSHCLDEARFKTLVHGDAKVANFCFSTQEEKVAAVDFQYVGGGTGVQDLAYLLGSALPEKALAENLPYLLDHYFSELGRELMAQGESQAFAQEVIEEWQTLFVIAWADFHRFIMGWSPTHAKNTPLSQKLTEQALQQLRNA
ncbi:phosphotransferase [Marinomonas sp. RSW2]|uniref:Phosphotransferase n=1 Tax=Marinomonas maritima TaxID=2940935 RepID=A0ABT5WHX0_9GAMM|nr:phosphotransferase [Marinomonas maritima]MDE8604408.1 phosphotransferase [Marinomonas maritima]